MIYSKDCLTENFKGVQALIHDTVYKFRKKYGIIEQEELISIGYMAFMKATQSYDEQSNSSYSTWVRYIVWKSLLDYLRQEYQARKHREQDELVEYQQKHLIDLTDGLCDDAKNIINLILNTPNDLLLLIRESGGSVKQMKRILTNHLSNMGWHTKRIRFAFEQIQKAL